MRFPATPGWGPPAVVVCGSPPAVVVGPLPLLAVGPGCGAPPLLAEAPGCGSPPLLAGVHWLWWWGPWVPFSLAVVCVCVLRGALCWCGRRGVSAGGGVGWAPATLGCGSWGRLPATPGWGPPAVAVGVLPGGGFPCCVCLWRGVCVWCLCWCVWCVFVVSVLVVVWVWACLLRVFLCVCVGACVVCWWCVLWCGVVCWRGRGRCVVWSVPRHCWQRFLCATPRHSWLGFAAGGGGRSSPLLAEGLECGSPPLLAWVRLRWWCAAPRPRWWLAPCHSRLWGRVAGPRHSWLGSAAVCRVRSFATPGRGPWSWFPATPGWGPRVVVVGALGALLLGRGVCVCAMWRFVLVWAACRGGGRARGGCCVSVCVCVRAVCGWWGVSYLGWFSLSVGMSKSRRRKAKKRPCRRVAEMRGMRHAYIHTSLFVQPRFCPPVARECVQAFGGSVGFFCVLCLVFPPPFFFRTVFDNIPFCLALSL